jgi:hypothetical protein
MYKQHDLRGDCYSIRMMLTCFNCAGPNDEFLCNRFFESELYFLKCLRSTSDNMHSGSCTGLCTTCLQLFRLAAVFDFVFLQLNPNPKALLEKAEFLSQESITATEIFSFNMKAKRRKQASFNERLKVEPSLNKTNQLHKYSKQARLLFIFCIYLLHHVHSFLLIRLANYSRKIRVSLLKLGFTHVCRILEHGDV